MLKKTLKIFCLTLFVLASVIIFQRPAQASSWGVSIGYSPWTPSTFWFRNYSSGTYDSSGITVPLPWYYTNYISFGPRYYYVKYPAPSDTQRRNDLRMCQRQAEVKKAIYFSQKAEEQRLTPSLEDNSPLYIFPPTEEEDTAPTINTPEIEIEHESYHPKDTQIMSQGTVVMNTY